jgi:hypothetical protein
MEVRTMIAKSPVLEAKDKDPHFGPNPGVIAVLFTIVFIAGLIPVTLIASDVHFPSPFQPPEEVVAYFKSEALRVRICAFFQLWSAILLGVFSATMVSRLRYHGAQSAAVTIALFGGFATALWTGLSALLSWVITQPGISNDEVVTRALHYMIYVVGGPGYSTFLGVFFAGISIVAGYKKLLPKGVVFFGFVLALMGGFSTLSLLFPSALFLIPLTRFPGFIWMIIAGFKMPKTRVLP